MTIKMDVEAFKLEEAQGTFVIIPTFNEEEVIRQTIQKVLEQGVHVVVVDDGSTDKTLSKLDNLPIHILHHVVNLGQGAALQTGIDFSLKHGARFIVTFDADGQHDEQDVPKLIQTLIQGSFDVVLGSRFLGAAPGMGFSRKLLIKLAIHFTKLTLRMDLTDVHNGLRAFRADVADQLRITQNGMAHATEILQKIKESKLKYVEIPTSIKYNAYSKAKGQSGLEAVNILYELIIRRLIR